MENHIQNSSESSNRIQSPNTDSWAEYSALHDTFTEVLSYERSRNPTSDFWQLNYI